MSADLHFRIQGGGARLKKLDLHCALSFSSNQKFVHMYSQKYSVNVSKENQLVMFTIYSRSYLDFFSIN
jgi:hypothetical protein